MSDLAVMRDPARMLLDRLNPYPAIVRLVEAQLRDWPAHARVLDKALPESDPVFLSRMDGLADLIWKLAGDDIDRYCADYHWMCNNFVDEQMFFRRNRRYRLQTFAEAVSEVYGNSEYMSRYVNGILLSQVFWHNHARAIDLFRTHFLPANRVQYDHLDVGPGHGLFLAYAATDPNCKSASAWDVSASSIGATKAALARMRISRPVSLMLQDVLQTSSQSGGFDSVIISEVLEHLERPDAALYTLHRALRTGGRIFINVPVNSPAPDHIYLWHHPDEIVNLIESCGFHIEDAHYIAATGKTLDEAIRQQLDISCVIIARA